ncbi:hypothetical protein ACN23B_15230 [Anabaena sp. FACHB-709]|uniref:Uncharacterized protein n=1 Tax=Anabaena cylindrica FACHB-318 TaxID=2692880 RepID=A0ABR7ZD38_ANACY|nr:MULTISPECIES: hypothetical protein [Nostocaceae]MBD2170243.1 hypothetical protein [Anabaena cylindrica FACHB-318]MBD2281864.1 hypothetical protein [Anabaena cylindrica FACHB-170]
MTVDGQQSTALTMDCATLKQNNLYQLRLLITENFHNQLPVCNDVNNIYKLGIVFL